MDRLKNAQWDGEMKKRTIFDTTLNIVVTVIFITEPMYAVISVKIKPMYRTFHKYEKLYRTGWQQNIFVTTRFARTS